MTFSNFMDLVARFDSKSWSRKVPATTGHVHCASLILPEHIALESVASMLSIGNPLFVITAEFADKCKQAKTCCIYFIEQGYKTVTLSEYDTNNSVGPIHEIKEEKHHEGIVGITYGIAQTGILVGAAGFNEAVKTVASEIEVRIIHNAIFLGNNG